MGMAASQARFLSLTARKNNTEYEGQQINQQRTTLSNKSASYYNDLLGMSVPVPPSAQDYTKTVYSFQDGALNNSIGTMIANTDGSYTISYTSSWTDDFAAVSAASSVITKSGSRYFVGAKELRSVTSMNFFYEEEDNSGNKVIHNCSYEYDKDQKKWIMKNDQGVDITGNIPSNLSTNSNDPYLKSLSGDQLWQTLLQEAEYQSILNEQYGNATWMVRYVQNTTTGTWSPYFYKKEVMDKATYGENGNSLSNIPAYTIGTAQKTEEIKGVKARIEMDATGRLINITLKPGEDDEATFALTTNTTTDQAALDDAMNQYEFDKYQYEQSIQEINAKIEIIQAEDKDLELRLKQLDTEQDAISNELDAVQKVIEKNVESSFKTFG